MRKPIIGITLDYHINEEGFAYAESPWYALRCDYSQIVVNSGGIPVFLSHDSPSNDTLSVIDGLVISGGDFDIPPKLYGQETLSGTVREGRERALYELELTKRALDRDIPFLGVCNGIQVLNVALGGDLIQDVSELMKGSISHKQPSPKNKPYHSISIENNTKLYAIAEGQADWMVTSTHHQALGKLGRGLIPSAFAPDGIIEAVELEGYRFVLGAQWHPEYGSTKLDQNIFSAFVAASAKSRN